MPIGSQDEFSAAELALLPPPDDEQQAGDTSGAPESPAGETAPSATTSEQPAAKTEAQTEAPPEKPQGDLRNALRASRRAEREAREKAERLAREVEELRAKVPKQSDPDEITDDDIAELEEQSPAAAKLARKLKAVAPPKTEAPAPTEAPRSEADVVQEAIDDNPTLLAWQTAEDKTTWALAVQADNYLRTHPQWASKSVAERFAEVVRRVNADLGTSQATPPEPKPIPRGRPNSLSDLGPGSAPNGETLTLERMQKMSDEDILQALLRSGH